MHRSPSISGHRRLCGAPRGQPGRLGALEGAVSTVEGAYEEALYANSSDYLPDTQCSLHKARLGSETQRSPPECTDGAGWCHRSFPGPFFIFISIFLGPWFIFIFFFWPSRLLHRQTMLALIVRRCSRAMGNPPEVPRCRIQPALLSIPDLCFHPHRPCILVYLHLHRWRRGLLHRPVQLASRSRAMDNRSKVPQCRIQPVLLSMPLLHLHL